MSVDSVKQEEARIFREEMLDDRTKKLFDDLTLEESDDEARGLIYTMLDGWRDTVEREVVNLAEGMVAGQPKVYSWAKQNYNAGHDQALRVLVKEIRLRAEKR